jgi:hypothetical protein
MKQLILITAVLFLLTSSSFGSDSARYVYKITLSTKQANRFKGILVSVTDSAVIAFPGNWSELKRKKLYKTVQFSFKRIEQIHLKRKGRIRNGMMAGGVAGALMAQKVNSGDKSNQNISFTTAISITGGTIAGGVVVSKLNDRIFINGNKDLFQHFIKIVKPYLQ